MLLVWGSDAQEEEAVKSWIQPDSDKPYFWPRFAVVAIGATIINIALLGAAVWIVVKVLQWTGVIS